MLKKKSIIRENGPLNEGLLLDEGLEEKVIKQARSKTFQSQFSSGWMYLIHLLEKYQEESSRVKIVHSDMIKVYNKCQNYHLNWWKKYPVRVKTESEIIIRYRSSPKRSYMICPFDLHSWNEIEEMIHWEKFNQEKILIERDLLKWYTNETKTVMRACFGLDI